MYKRCNRIRTLMIAAALFAVAGCATTPPPTFYQLEEPASIHLSGLESGIAIGLGPVNMAAYLDRPQIVTRAEAHKLQLSESNATGPSPLHTGSPCTSPVSTVCWAVTHSWSHAGPCTKA